MAETLYIPESTDRKAVYEALVPQIKALLDGETNLVANLANVAAVLREAFGFFWVGFYLKDQHDLVLGPFQGPLACTRIPFTKGVCGHAFTTESTVLVPDVDQFPGHIACSSASKSEVVVPVRNLAGHVVGVLDVDSDALNDFSEIDVKGLEAIVDTLAPLFS